MKVLGKYWKALLSFFMIAAAAFIYFRIHLPAKDAYELEKNNLIIQNSALQTSIANNRLYDPVLDQLDPSMEEITASREELYANFPVEMREEDQIMYMLYLEEKFGKEVVFSFAEAEILEYLHDGSVLQGVTIAFDYETTYDGFKNMIKELATDTRITSVRYATLDYDRENGTLSGQMTVILYLLNDGREYQEPDVQAPATGKENPFNQ